MESVESFVEPFPLARFSPLAGIRFVERSVSKKSLGSKKSVSVPLRGFRVWRLDGYAGRVYGLCVSVPLRGFRVWRPHTSGGSFTQSDRFQSPYGDLESGDLEALKTKDVAIRFQSPYGDLESGDSSLCFLSSKSFGCFSPLTGI